MASRPPFEFKNIPLKGISPTSLNVVSGQQTLPRSDMLIVCLRGGCKALESSANKPNTEVDTSFVVCDEITKRILDQLVARASLSGVEGKIVVARAAEAGSHFNDVACLDLGTFSPDNSSVIDTLCSFVRPSGISPFVGSKLGKAIAARALEAKVKHLTLAFKPGDISPQAAQRLLEEVLVWKQQDARFKGTKNELPASSCLETITVAVNGGSSQNAYTLASKNAKKAALGEQLARELVNAPANVCTTESLAVAARQIAEEYSFSSAVVLGEAECVERKMGAYLAVAQGSLYPPQFIHLTYKPPATNGVVQKRIAFVGKGICMDTGGYNLKVGAGIETMKFDMGGAAAVLGAARIIGEQKPPNVEVHFIIPAAENMISARASRPGDIVTASNGMTIEIGNTDAEGRLTLADGLAYAASEVKPDFILDCATLTGASIVGLGSSVGALYGTNCQWTKNVLERYSYRLCVPELFGRYRRVFVFFN